MQSKLLVIHLLLLVEVLIVGVIIFSQVLISSSTTTSGAAAAVELIEIELEDKAIKQELETRQSEEIEEEVNTAKQQEEEEEQPLPLGITIIQESPLLQSPLLANVTSTIPPTALAGGIK